MKNKKFTPIVLTDKRQINYHYDWISRIVDSLNETKNLYIKDFGNFDMNIFLDMFYKNNPKKTAFIQFVKQNKINLTGMDIDKVMKQGFVKAPDFTMLIKMINVVQKSIRINDQWNYINRIDELFDNDLQKFVKLSEVEQNPVKDRIINIFRVETKTERENEFINEIRTMANTSKKFIYEYGIMPKNTYPDKLFSITQAYKDKSISIYISPYVLTDFRKQFEKTSAKNKMIL